MNPVLDRVTREPVLLGAAALATFEALLPDASPAAKLAAAAWVAWGQRTFSTSKRTAEENVEVARYVGVVEGQAQTSAPVKRARKAAPKAGG